MNSTQKQICATAGMRNQVIACSSRVDGTHCSRPAMQCEHQRPENVTKEGIEVKPGQVWHDLDKRMSNRHCKVVASDGGKAVMHECRADGSDLLGLPSSVTTKISIRRMHKSSTGWALVLNVN